MHPSSAVDLGARPAVWALVALLAAFGCGVPVDAGHDLGGPQVERFLKEGTTTTTRPPQRPVVVTIFLTAAPYEPADPSILVPVVRSVESPASAQKALAALAGGPTGDDLHQGFSTAIQSGAPLEVSGPEGETVTVDVPLDFAGGFVTQQITAFAQIVYTVTALPDITAVRFTSGGRPLQVPFGNGTTAAVPVTRLTYASLAPRPG